MKTAVEWLVEQLDSNIMWTQKAKELYNQAKEMEKQQMKNAYKKCILSDDIKFFDDYYNETFKSK